MKHLSDKKRYRVREHFYINSRCCAKLAAVALTAGLTLAGGLTVQAINFNDRNGIGTIPNARNYDEIYGWQNENEAAEGGDIEVNGTSSTQIKIYGGYSKSEDANNNKSNLCRKSETELCLWRI
ncbi:hypothetical protein E0L13_00885 [Megasphaera sp. SW808]|uniref:hypothetical protein n=1 Tax=Megasphaera sp. SW808 TaxID=2530045 RepID=UPI0014393970|nr:hypothetical protein [Megasphaera sp. SW808]NJE33584.1 hypothetical protein [Megasphaera sp. SW808]